MPQMRANTLKDEGILFYVTLLTGFFILLEVSFFLQVNKAYLADYSFMANNMKIPVTILPGIFYFIFAQGLVHFIYILYVWSVTLFIGYLLQLTSQQKLFLAIFSWTSGIVTILLKNQHLFPNSKFSMITIALIDGRGEKILMFITSLICVLLIFLAMVGLLKFLWKKSIFYFIYFFALLFNLTLIYLTPEPVIENNVATKERPNIIIIGVDSLRPDFLSYFGYPNATPFFDNFLTQATVFSDAVTPLARTFPAWNSILTGLYPKKSGVRTNLLSDQKLNFHDTLPAILQRNGYETMYATDEARFSNIDKQYGFERIITPPMGLNDFLLGTINDFPISNLIVNTKVGKWLFPYSYANRPVYYTYQPKTFLNLLRGPLLAKKSRPIFLTVHFCLTHYPYIWAKFAEQKVNYLERYSASVREVDRQIDDFLKLLQQARLLDHAVVVLLSDHGEALELAGDRITSKEFYYKTKKQQNIPKFYPPGVEEEAVDQTAGHGTDVLGLSQYHSLLAFKFFGLAPQNIGDVPYLVSLMDIKPTLLQFLQLSNDSSDGKSLLNFINGKDKVTAVHDDIFLESDYTPEALRTVHPETQKLVLEGIQLFQINPVSARLTVKDSMLKMIIESKQFATIHGKWMLALYPQGNKNYVPILINLTTGEWSNRLDNVFALKSPAKLMLQRLQAFYSVELKDMNMEAG